MANFGSPVPRNGRGDGQASIYSWVEIKSVPPDQVSRVNPTDIIASGRNRQGFDPVRVEMTVDDGQHDLLFNDGELEWKCSVTLPAGGIAPTIEPKAIIRGAAKPTTRSPVATLKRQQSLGHIPEQDAPRHELGVLTFPVTIV